MHAGTAYLNDEQCPEFPRAQRCRFIEASLPECYCTNITSLNIPKMLAFCGGDYERCKIYRNRTGSRKQGGEPPDRPQDP